MSQIASAAHRASAASAPRHSQIIGRGCAFLALLLAGCGASRDMVPLEAEPMSASAPAPTSPGSIAEADERAVDAPTTAPPMDLAEKTPMPAQASQPITVSDPRVALEQSPEAPQGGDLRDLGYINAGPPTHGGATSVGGLNTSQGLASRDLEEAGASYERAQASGRVAKTTTRERKLEAQKDQAQVLSTPGSELYTNYGTNPMTATAQDHLSTFSIDVDTASYTLARRKLSEGALPSQDAVRVEEFVNYFHYRYQGPTGDAPFAVNLEGAPSPWEPQHQLLRVGVQGKALDPGKERPRHLTFLVDVSGSMQSDDKIGLVKQGLHTLVQNLGSEDSIALVTYAGSTRVVLPSTPVTRRSVIDDAIEELSAGGSTAMGSGLQLAYQQASRAYASGAENRVLVLSDGDANVGPTSYEEILSTIAQYKNKGITLSTFGFGEGNYKDTTMEQLADKGDGNYTYIDSAAQARRAFGQDLSATMDTIARDVKIQVDFDPAAVIAWRLVGYENRDIADRDFRNDKVDAGEVGSGHSVTALYDVILSDDALNRGEPLATVRIRAKKPGPDVPAREFATKLTSAAFRDSMSETSSDFRIATAAASFAEVLRGSRYASELNFAQVYQLAKGATRKGYEEDRELLDLIARAGQISGQPGPWNDRLTADR